MKEKERENIGRQRMSELVRESERERERERKERE